MLADGGVEQDPDEWWKAIVCATRRLLERRLAPVSEIGGICCTGQWSGTVAVDEAGAPLRNAIIWMDARGAPYVSKITGGLVAMDGYGLDKVWAWVRRTGGIPTHSGKDSIAHILFLRDQHRNIYDRTHKFLEPKDYINLRLTGSFATSVDSITLHWVTDNRDLLNVNYDDRLLKLATLDRRKLPDIRQSTEVLGPILPQVAAGAWAWRPCTDRDGIAGLAGHSRRLGRGGRLRAAPLYRHIVLAELPSALQKDGPGPQHGGAAVGLAGQIFPGQRARTGRGLSDLSAPSHPFPRRRAGPPSSGGRPVSGAGSLGRSDAAWQPWPALHALAARRAHAGQRQHAARRLPQHVACRPRGWT